MKQFFTSILLVSVILFVHRSWGGGGRNLMSISMVLWMETEYYQYRLNG
jgi:hypothetical protein